MDLQHVRVKRERLTSFCATIFERLGLPPADAQVAAKVLVAADARGIPSHGVARLERYVNGLLDGVVIADAAVEVLADTPTSIVLHAHGAMGAPVSARAMRAVIAKAAATGAAFGCVRDSNHFGIAGYYAMMAMEQDMIGIAMTNTAALGVPTFGRQVMFGTNPIAFAAPAHRECGFVLDMATTVVTRGKIEVYDRLDESLPPGWAVDKTGTPATDAHRILEDMFHRVGGGIMPLGGAGELHGGHKGYGMGVMVDILCAVLCGAPFGRSVADTESSSGRVSHFFGAVRIDTFRDPMSFRQDMDDLLRDLRTSPPAEGAERVYFGGLKEFEREWEAAEKGVLLLRQTYDHIASVGQTYGVEPPPVA
ncbi:MAG TPA: Ldh family oxidoreductase [Anaerolineae bacterium]|nr:Ldh family oxidoreductase [Anaerolineae bacterium]